MTQAILIPADGPLREIRLERRDGGHLRHLQELVGGSIEAIPVRALDVSPGRITGREADETTAYVNEEGKFDPDRRPNMRATDYLVPGIGLFFGDHVAGTMILVGFDPRTGEHTETVPRGPVERARLIAEESGAGWEAENAIGQPLKQGDGGAS